MIEPSVPFKYPAEDEPQDLDAARFAGRVEAMRLLLELLGDCRNPALHIAALRYLSNPREKTVAEIARGLGVARMTVQRALRSLRAFSILAK